jgi:hypothetical protein
MSATFENNNLDCSGFTARSTNLSKLQLTPDEYQQLRGAPHKCDTPQDEERNRDWTGSDDDEGWPQDTDWGHESKYGNKRFGKGRMGHM